MESNASYGYRLVRHVISTAVLILAVAVAASYLLGRSESAFSIAAGSTIAMASFAVLVMVVVRTMAGGRGAYWIAALGMAKIFVIGAVLWWIMKSGAVEPLAFLVGFSTMVLALLVEGVRKNR
ncbi:MAG TPA: ATP synthase subunit I [bacterium]|nr:ATP synthase subunit I [bacterium]